MTISLLTTKLYFPPQRPALVSRPRLVERLQIGLRSPLTLISAPAGYGKTTLLSEWRAGPGSRMPVAWLSLDVEDNNLSRFLLYLATALGSLKAGIGESASALLQSPQPPPTQIILTALINDLVGALSTPYALVLDDYHIITSQTIHEAITFLLEHMPPELHLIILTRADPSSLPLVRLRGRGQLTEIRSADLRFTIVEATVFLNRVMGLALSDEQVEALEGRTEGWVTGLQLAALSMRGRDDIQDFVSALSGSHRYIVDYLAEEALNSQFESLREFLLKTSILERLTAPLCNVLTNRTDGQEVLENLEHANLFIIPLDDERRWYRYHHLFADVLRNRLGQIYPDVITELHRCSAEWHEHSGLIDEAMKHAIAGDDWNRAVRLIEQNAWFMIERGELVTLAGWLNAMQFHRPLHPWLCIYHAWERALTGHSGELQPFLQEAEQIINSQSDAESEQTREMRGHIATIRAFAAGVQPKATHVIALAGEALELLPESNLSVRSIATWALGAAYLLNNDIPRGKVALVESAHVGKVTGNLLLTVAAMRLLAHLEMVGGRLDKAAEMCREAIRLASGKSGKPFPVAAELFISKGNLEYEWNHLELAAQDLEEGLGLSQAAGDIDAMIGCRASLARLCWARGDRERALKLLREAEELKRQSYLAPTWHSILLAAQIRTCLTGGNISFAAQIAEDAGITRERTDDWLRESAYLAFARALLAQGEVDQALALLKRRCRKAECTDRWGHVIEATITKSICYQATGDQTQALTELERALSLAEPCGYVRVFLDEGAPMYELLRRASSQGITPKYVAKLLAEFNKEPGFSSLARQPLIEPLSERELEILRLVAAGKSNQEIADTLIIATGTVKKHLHNIFGKLGVQSRTQCLAKARELGLG